MAKSGDTIGRWILGRRLDGGGQGIVFAASSEEGQPETAIKILNCTRPKKKSRFIQEVRVHLALASQGAPNIIPIIDHNLDELQGEATRGYIVMPMAVTTLEREKGLLTGRTELCIEIFRGIVTGIDQAHTAAVVHRDIKPGNILFLDRTLKRPLVSDFGICFLRDTPDEKRLTETGETVGAKFFMAPEQERGGVVDVTQAADIYALGKLLHHMLTGRFLYRESLAEAFSEPELQADPRLPLILDQILRATILEDPTRRLQTAKELLARLDEITPSGSRGSGGSGGPDTTKSGGSVPGPSKTSSDSGLQAYQHYVDLLISGDQEKVRLDFDSLKNTFSQCWQGIYDEVRNTPANAPFAAQRLIKEQTHTTALLLAIARCDRKELFRPAKLFLEFLTKASERQAGYPAVFEIPHIHAGFLYMAMSVVALHMESWEMFNFLLTEEFEWYYQSRRPFYSYGFQHTYFFHHEAFGRRADKTHDFYRKQLTENTIIIELGLKDEDFLNIYLQVQLLMSLRVTQFLEQGKDIFLWPDFGRFDNYRVEPILDRMFHDNQYAKGILRAFGESKEKFFECLNNRLTQLSSRFQHSNYFWRSIKSWEPRDNT